MTSRNTFVAAALAVSLAAAPAPGRGQDPEKISLRFGPAEGTLQFRDITVDPATGSVTIRAVFPNPDNVLLPGMFVRAVVEEGVNDQALLVPQQGVSRDTKGQPYAWIVSAEGKVEQRPLELDRAIGDKWLVGKGLAVGDQIIVEGQLRVRPGSPVKAVPFEADGAKSGEAGARSAAAAAK